MNSLDRNVRQSVQRSRDAVAYASATWTLAWCYATGGHPLVQTLAAIPVLIGGIAALSRATPSR